MEKIVTGLIIFLFVGISSAAETQDYLRQGAAYFDAGKFDQAIEAFQKVVELNPQDANAHYNLGVAQYQNGKLKEAAESFKKAVSLDPEGEIGKSAEKILKEVIAVELAEKAKATELAELAQGQLTKIKGRVEFRAVPEEEWQPATIKTKLQEGYQLRTDKSAEAILTFGRQGATTLSEETSLEIKSLGLDKADPHDDHIGLVFLRELLKGREDQKGKKE